MATVKLGLGTSHGPMLSAPPERWDARVGFDKRNREHPFKGNTYTFDELVALRAGENLAREITLEKWKERHAACRAAITRLARAFDEARPDAAVIVGNDQMEVFDERLNPAFTVFRGNEIENIPYSAEIVAKMDPGSALSIPGYQTAEHVRYPGLLGLADHIVRALIGEEFDVAVSSAMPEGPRGHGTPHAFGFIYRQIMGDRVVPHVPILVNTFYPPNQPTAKRCLDFGRALARAITSWSERKTVALMCSGGLSHFVIDEEVDREVLAAIRDGEPERLAAIPESIFQAGTSEIKNWIPVAGAMAELGLGIDVVDYVPCYRSLAGTGNAMAFATWRP